MSLYRDRLLGNPCICDTLFKEFKWIEIVSVKPKHLPKKPGVYVIRIIEKGYNVEEIISKWVKKLEMTNGNHLLDI